MSEEQSRNRKKILIIAIVAFACLIVGCLIAFAACQSPKVTGVKSLTAANVKAQAGVDSYHIDGAVNMKIVLDSDELQKYLGQVTLKLPVKMKMKADAGTDSAHITTDASVKVFGKTVPVQTAEAYLDFENMVAYTRTGESPKWKKSGDEKEQMAFKDMAGGLAMIGKSIMKNAVFEESEEYYSIVMPAEKAGDLVTSLHLLDRVDLGIADVRDITVEGGQIKYNVDKETRLVSSIELEDVDVRGKGTYEGMSVDLKFPLNGAFRFSRYNELEESEYAIPEEVKASGAPK